LESSSPSLKLGLARTDRVKQKLEHPEDWKVHHEVNPHGRLELGRTRNLSGAELPWLKVFNHTNCHRIFRKYIVRLKFDGPNRRTLEIGQMLGGQLVAREN
jgi:hypothetical protein